MTFFAFKNLLMQQEQLCHPYQVSKEDGGLSPVSTWIGTPLKKSSRMECPTAPGKWKSVEARGDLTGRWSPTGTRKCDSPQSSPLSLKAPTLNCQDLKLPMNMSRRLRQRRVAPTSVSENEFSTGTANSFGINNGNWLSQAIGKIAKGM